jgi:hypothetical protein
MAPEELAMNVHELAKTLAHTFASISSEEGWTIEEAMSKEGVRRHQDDDYCVAYLQTSTGEVFSLTVRLETT